MSGNLRTLQDVESVTEDVLELAVEITDGWYLDTRIDWDDVWDRMDGQTIGDGTVLDIPHLNSPALRMIQRYIQNLRRQG